MSGSEQGPAWEIVAFAAENSALVEQVRELFREYYEWLGQSVCSRRLAEEIADLPGPYAPPEGRLLLARRTWVEEGHCEASTDHRREPLGCVGVRPHHAEACEVKRLYVRPAARGMGLGRALLDAALAAAREIGYREALVTTLPDTMPTAREMYVRSGFGPTEPFVDHSHVDESVRMEYLRLEL